MTGDDPTVWAPGGAMDGDPPDPDDDRRTTRRARRRRWRPGSGVVPAWVVGIVIVALVVTMFLWPRPPPDRADPIAVDNARPPQATTASTSTLDATGTTATPATSSSPQNTEPETRPETSSPAGPSSLTTPLGLGLESDLRATVLTTDGTIHEIDLAADTVTSTAASPIQSGAPAYVFVDGDAITVVAYDNVPGFRLDADRSVEVIAPDDQPAGLLHPGPLPATAWQIQSASRERLEAALLDLRGAPTGPTVAVDGELIAGDGRGGLVVDAAGGFYVVGADSTRRLTPGELMAVAAEHALAYECDADLRCAHVRIDRSTGERVDLDPTVSQVLSGLSEGPATRLLGGAMSPDGRVAVVRVEESDMRHVFVDLDTGAAVEVVLSQMPTAIVWSSDGRFALFASEAGLLLYDRGSIGIVAVGIDGLVKAVAAPVARLTDADL